MSVEDNFARDVLERARKLVVRPETELYAYQLLAFKGTHMRIRKRSVLLACCVALGFGVATLTFAIPGAAACALIEVRGFDSLPDGTLVESGSSAQEQARFLELLSGAKARIERTFGTHRAEPTVLFFQDSRAFWPLKLNAHGSTSFVASRACVMVGPNGQNLDVVAHELMHAELVERVGYWRRFMEVPVWFDEGVAMQVDFRPRNELPKGEPIDTTYVRQLESARHFFQPNEQRLVRNYASAKVEVTRWLSEVGAQSLYQRFERIRAGEQLNEVLAK